MSLGYTKYSRLPVTIMMNRDGLRSRRISAYENIQAHEAIGLSGGRFHEASDAKAMLLMPITSVEQYHAITEKCGGLLIMMPLGWIDVIKACV